MIKSKAVKLLFVFVAVFFISCEINNSENTNNEVKENLEILSEGITSLNKSIKEVKDSQDAISKRMASLEKSINNLALNSKNNPADNKKQQPSQADPNKVYNASIGDSFVQGNKDAKVTIIEWADYF